MKVINNFDIIYLTSRGKTNNSCSNRYTIHFLVFMEVLNEEKHN